MNCIAEIVSVPRRSWSETKSLVLYVENSLRVVEHSNEYDEDSCLATILVAHDSTFASISLKI
jgi:hypothetical protein